MAGLNLEEFRNPPMDCRPFMRWWWFGTAVTKEELARELEEMRDKGIGGVEIQPVYPLDVDDPGRGIAHLHYLSPEWLEMLKFAVQKAQELGMIVDITFGSGWPFGGPHIPKALSAGCLKYYSSNLSGPSVMNGKIPGGTGEDEELLRVLAARDAGGALEEAGMTDLTSLVSAEGGITWEVPEGSWKMMAFFRSHTRQMVKRATVGSEGRVLDHFSLEALQKHIDWVGEAFRGAVGPAFGKTVRAMFCDSWEVFGSDWTPAFPDEFRKRRAYDLGPYLPALWNDIGPKTPLVRFDYWQTLSELSLEKFFEPFAAWCADNGLKARVQAHGTPSDVLRSYGVSQIPEGEGSGPHVIISVRRQAASATRLYGREICSAEAFTWLQRPRYIVTMEQIKASADAFFQDGINHIVHHGYSYSPPSVGVPGWVFYASILANHNNTWWKYYRPLSDYMGRISYALRQGHFVADLCVYLPYNDTWGHWRKGAFPTLHLSSEVEKWMGP